MTNTYPATHVRVDTNSYRSNHGAEPRGTGGWMFYLGTELWAAPRGTFGEAKKAAKREAGSRGLTFVTVAS